MIGTLLPGIPEDIYWFPLDVSVLYVLLTSLGLV